MKVNINKNGEFEMETKKEKKRAVTITLNAEQIKELGENKELREEVINQLNSSEGGLKGTMAFAIAKAIIKQTKMKL